MIEAGINIEQSISVSDMKLVRGQLGPQAVRIGWEDDWTFADLAQRISDLHLLGFAVVLCVTPGDRSYGSKRFIDFCVAASRLLDPKRGDRMEVHNEPNHIPFAAVPNAKNYANEFVAVMRAVRVVNPDLKVLIGGFSPDSGDRDPRQFLPAMIRANPGVLDADGVCVHTYEFPYDPRTFSNAWNPVGYLNTLDAILDFCDRPNMPFHITEFGAPSGTSALGSSGKASVGWPQAPYRYSPDMQAEWLVRYLEAFNQSTANVVAAQVFTLNDGVTTGSKGPDGEWEPYTGLRSRPDASGKFTWKPISKVFRTWALAVTKK